MTVDSWPRASNENQEAANKDEGDNTEKKEKRQAEGRRCGQRQTCLSIGFRSAQRMRARTAAVLLW